MDAVIVLETETKYNELMFQVLGWRKQANPTDQYPEQTHILEQVTSLRRTLNLDSKNYLVDHSQQDWPGGQETAGQLRRSEGRQAREREGPERTHSRRPSGVLRWGLSCSPQQQVGRCFNIQYYHTSWIASSAQSIFTWHERRPPGTETGSSGTMSRASSDPRSFARTQSFRWPGERQ